MRWQGESESQWPSGIKKVCQFLVDNREVDDLNFQEKFWRIINRINATLTFGTFGQSLAISAKDIPNAGLQLGNQLDFLENHIVSQLEQLKDCNLFILVDKVDEIWIDDASSCHMAVGLIMATKEINIKFVNVRCIIFLRSDIYRAANYDPYIN